MAMKLTGNVAGMLKLLGGGSDVEITQLLTEGVAIAIVKVDDDTITLYAPDGGGSTVEVTPALLSGTKVADIEVDGDTISLYAPAPTSVSINQVQQTGTKIATITVNGSSTDIYAPEGGSSGGESYSTTEWDTGNTWIDGRHIYGRVVDLGADTEVTTSWKAMGLLVPEISFFLNAWGIRESNGQSISLNAWNQYDANYSLAVQAKEWGMVRYIIITYVKNS